MIPKSLSASSIQVSELCPARWKAENYDRTPQITNAPAGVGTSFHFAVEKHVEAVYINHTTEWDDIAHLKAMYDLGFVDTFGHANFDGDDSYADGAALVASWYDRWREGLPSTVLSCEVKESFPVKTSVGEIPFNFIWDRADQLEEDVYEIVDYKTIRAYVTPDDLKKKVQPRAYALAGQIKWPHAKRIWVTFDLVRHNTTVSVAFSREENIMTYRYLQRAAERIIEWDENDVEERLNPECHWCVRKFGCETLAKAHESGSINGASIEEIALKRLKVQSAIKALEYLDAELDAVLVKEAMEHDTVEFEAGGVQVEITASARRAANSAAIAQLVGPEMMARWGNFTVTNVDKMLKSGELEPEVVNRVKQYITKTYGEPKSKVKLPTNFEE